MEAIQQKSFSVNISSKGGEGVISKFKLVGEFFSLILLSTMPIYLASSDHVKVIANPIFLKCNAPTHFLQNCDL